jgi:hypothetical protein
MNELEKLIADFKVTLDKFEAIASRMEARIAQLDPVDPLADLPPLPPVPEGYSRWVYRGKGWKSETKVQFAAMGRYNWVTQPFGRTSGYNTSHYIEAVKDESVAPEGLLPFPPVPEGYSRWQYRGKGWKTDKRVRFASMGRFDTDWVTFPFGCTVGYETTHYIEAVKDPS